MKKKVLKIRSSLLTIAMCGVAVPAFAQDEAAVPQQPSPQAAQSSAGLTDIVVTARRREESIQTAP